MSIAGILAHKKKNITMSTFTCKLRKQHLFNKQRIEKGLKPSLLTYDSKTPRKLTQLHNDAFFPQIRRIF